MYKPKFFTLPELLASVTAINNDIHNLPDFEHVENLLRLCELVLDPAREQLNLAIRVTSGYRNPYLNSMVGGSKNSQHMQGLAVDLICLDNDKLFKILETNPYIDQLLYEHSNRSKWIHVSIASKGTKPRGDIRPYYKV